MDLSIIIVNWNTKAYLRNCLESIYQNTDRINFEIIVVDNASTDGSVEMIKEKFPNAKLIENTINFGFAKANNIAFPEVKGRYILLLNSDTTIFHGAFDKAIQFLDLDDSIGALTPRILNEDGSIQHPCYIAVPSITSEIIITLYLDKIFPSYSYAGRHVPADDEIREVVHACGACLFLRRAALDEVGFLDENMIFSYEDVDLCIRLKKKSWKIFYYPEVIVTHYGGKSRENLYDEGISATLTSKYYFFKKYKFKYYIVTLKLICVLRSIIRILQLIILHRIRKSKRSQISRYIAYHIKVINWHLKLEQ